MRKWNASRNARRRNLPTAPRSSRLPSLDLLKGFEAAARHLRFTRAAEELFLTQSALSRQMQTLEEQLGVALFERRHRELRLTDAGQVLQVDRASRCSTSSAQAVAKIRREQSVAAADRLDQSAVRLAMADSAAGAFSRPPSGRSTCSSPPTTASSISSASASIWRCATAPRRWRRAGAPRLFGERLLPVCSPALAADRARPLKHPEDLARHVLLHIDDERGRYPVAQLVGVARCQSASTNSSPAGSLRFNHFDQVIQAALDGQGVALGRVPLIDSLLAQGRLVAPFPQHATRRHAPISSSAARMSRIAPGSAGVRRLADARRPRDESALDRAPREPQRPGRASRGVSAEDK